MIISENTECHLDRFNTYSINLKLKNNGVDTIRFWIMDYTKGLNFFFNKNDVSFYYLKCIRDGPIIITLEPKQEYKVDGCIFSKNRLTQNEKSNLSIGFKFYDIRKFKQIDFINDVFEKLYLSTDSVLFTENEDTLNVKSYPDTIWNNKKIKFVSKIN